MDRKGLVLLSIGVLLGALGFALTSDRGSLADEHAGNDHGVSDTAALEERLIRLEDAVRSLEKANDASRRATLAHSEGRVNFAPGVEPEPGSPADPERTTAEPESGRAARAGPMQTIEDLKHLGWMDVVPRKLCEILVEHGMTPFDRGVREFLPQAAERYRTVVEEHSRESVILRKQQKGLSRTDPSYQELSQRLRNLTTSRDQVMQEILTAFRARLRELAFDK